MSLSTVLPHLWEEIPAPNGQTWRYCSLARLTEAGLPVRQLPISLRVLLESVARHWDHPAVGIERVGIWTQWKPDSPPTTDIPFFVSRVLLQDFTGVPLLVDLAALRSELARQGGDPLQVEPVVPVDLVIDHSVQVDFFGSPEALQKNMEREIERNHERYQFLKWSGEAFRGLRVIPPGVGIVHQVNLEYLAKLVCERETPQGRITFFDTLVGTDSHTTMINGLGVLGWGVGGIEAEASMLGEPLWVTFPRVIGVYLRGELPLGVTATDLVLHLTERLRRYGVVGSFVEFFGPGATALSVPDRATIANMAPEYGATIAYFPPDQRVAEYLVATGRPRDWVASVASYCQAQGVWGIPDWEHRTFYTDVLEVDLGSVEPSVAGPRRPQDRIPLARLKERWQKLLQAPVAEGGYGIDAGAASARFPFGRSQSEPPGEPTEPANPVLEPSEVEMADDHPVALSVSQECLFPREIHIGHGSVVIAAITSCTNTSNPSVMVAAGLVAKHAVERGLQVAPYVKTSLAPGSRAVPLYLKKAGLMPYLERLGFYVVGFGCTTCIGNSGPLDPCLEQLVAEQKLVVASVLSGNRNFEARIHPAVRANFLCSPPLVVAFALAGRIDCNLLEEPIGFTPAGEPVYLRDIWPSQEELWQALAAAWDAELFRAVYDRWEEASPAWKELQGPTGPLFPWREESTYIAEPPFFRGLSPEPEPVTDILGARALAILGDSITTDHISPAGSIRKDSPAGQYLLQKGVEPKDFNSYGARRGNHEVMVRGTFANVRLRNLMTPELEGGWTEHQPSGQRMSIFEAACRYREEGIPLVIFAGKEYGAGSSRDWAAKGTRLLGVRAIVAESFERIHRSNLVGMGVLPCTLEGGFRLPTLGLTGKEVFSIVGIEPHPQPRAPLELHIHAPDGTIRVVPLRACLEGTTEVEYFRHGGILPYVFRKLLNRAKPG
ncbi:aconitate hydratase [Candidatus Methylacidithermus pantelleriae]|uniref:Aconitate hydratase A n=1 Tax=Candidatus Methylacidithermus pantelleriae TaxID=2744239 RepID=A0A8J2BLE0_9BACT|nr:aconitate hydratase [Candidatus Methylacidithermus pantelleriae]CAF0692951.1 Aconitate hydratase (aconitase) [Candidatus Methylacidithermus pantelleriae]